MVLLAVGILKLDVSFDVKDSLSLCHPVIVLIRVKTSRIMMTLRMQMKRKKRMVTSEGGK